MSKTIALRLNNTDYELFEKLCGKDKPSEVLKQLIHTALDAGLINKEIECEDIEAVTLDSFLRKHGIRESSFTLESFPQFWYSDDMDFSWMFTTGKLKEYIISKTSGEVHEGWYIDAWLWCFIWVWKTVGVLSTWPDEDLVEIWKRGHDPVEEAVGFLMGRGKDEEVRRVFEYYLRDEERTMRW